MKIIAKKDLFINDEIRVREVRLVGLDGEQLGIKPLSEAQAIADDANVDLVLIQPQATPPVAKIMDYGKFKFEYQKKQKEQRKKQSVVTVKEVRLSPVIDKGGHRSSAPPLLPLYSGRNRQCLPACFLRSGSSLLSGPAEPSPL